MSAGGQDGVKAPEKKPSLEDRVAALEAEVKRLKDATSHNDMRRAMDSLNR